MKKSDFFDEKIVAFVDTSKDPHLHDPEPPIGPSSLNVVYYEWSKERNAWLKLLETDPEPDQTMPNGSFDGQIIEVDLST